MYYIEIRRVSVVLLYMQNEAMDNNKISYIKVWTLKPKNIHI